MADRYTYVPLIGLFIAASLGGLSDSSPVGPDGRNLSWSRALPCCRVLMILARSQVETWQSSLTLFERALASTKVNPLAHHNIGAFYLDKGDCQKAVPHFLEAIRIKETYAYPYHGLGVCASRQTPPTGAHLFLQEGAGARSLDDAGPDRPRYLYMKQEEFGSAAEDFEQALRIKPDHDAAHANLGLIYMSQGRLGDRRGSFERSEETQSRQRGGAQQSGSSLHTTGKDRRRARCVSKSPGTRSRSSPDRKESANTLEGRRERTGTDRGRRRCRA
ncbi:MAG: tetratricopeptide repeat protein [Desulfobacterales bacterium]|nr:tetratricopeptide repeat protein [Desulfobacterales bacterium]